MIMTNKIEMMNDITAKLSEMFTWLRKYIKAPNYLIAGLIILFLTVVLFPILKFLIITLAAIFIFVGFNPEHDLSQQVIEFVNKFK